MTNVGGEILQRPTSVLIHLNAKILQEYCKIYGYAVQCGVEPILELDGIGAFHFIFISEGIASPKTLLRLAQRIEQTNKSGERSFTPILINSLKYLGGRNYTLESFPDELLIHLNSQGFYDVLKSRNWAYHCEYMQANVYNTVFGIFRFCIVGKEIYSHEQLHRGADAIKSENSNPHVFMELIHQALLICSINPDREFVF